MENLEDIKDNLEGVFNLERVRQFEIDHGFDLRDAERFDAGTYMIALSPKGVVVVPTQGNKLVVWREGEVVSISVLGR